MIYDAVGNVTSVTDAKGRTTSFTYNLLNQLTKTTVPAPFALLPVPQYNFLLT